MLARTARSREVAVIPDRSVRYLPAHQIRAFVWERIPLTIIGENWYLSPQPFEWVEVQYLPRKLCDHTAEMCRICMRSWYYTHNIRLVDSTDASNSIDLDVMSEHQLKREGRWTEPTVAGALDYFA